MTGSSRKTKENSLPEVSENGGTVATQFAYSVWKFIFEANCANILGNLNKHGRNWIICLNNRRCDLWCMQSRHDSRWLENPVWLHRIRRKPIFIRHWSYWWALKILCGLGALVLPALVSVFKLVSCNGTFVLNHVLVASFLTFGNNINLNFILLSR